MHENNKYRYQKAFLSSVFDYYGGALNMYGLCVLNQVFQDLYIYSKRKRAGLDWMVKDLCLLSGHSLENMPVKHLGQRICDNE